MQRGSLNALPPRGSIVNLTKGGLPLFFMQ
jgi:hypothetical protein